MHAPREDAATAGPLAAILAEIEAEHQAWLALLGGIPPAAATWRSSSGAWSAVDALAHVTAWQENAVRIARRLADPDAPSPGTNDGPASVMGLEVTRFNAQVWSAHQDWSADRALAWSRRVHGELVAALRALPTRRILGGRGRYGSQTWYWQPAVAHAAAHRRVLAAELAQRAGRPMPPLEPLEAAALPRPAAVALAARTLRLRCPVCGQGRVFQGRLTMAERCPTCAYRFEREEGYWVGAMIINYSAVAFVGMAGIFFGQTASWPALAQLAFWSAVVLVFGLWFFPYSRLLWMAFDLLFMSPPLVKDFPPDSLEE